MGEGIERLLLLLALAGWLVAGVLRQQGRLGARRGTVRPRRRPPAADPSLVGAETSSARAV